MARTIRMEGNMKITNDVAKMLRDDFPLLQTTMNTLRIVYLDNGATSQKPKQVINAIKTYYETSNANIHRGIYKLSEDSSELYADAKQVTADFINADPKEIIFTRNTTESLNLVASQIQSLIPKGKTEIVLTEIEHHSNLVPWQQLAKRTGMDLQFITLKDDYTIDIEDAKRKITKKTAILAFPHVSNVLGTVLPARELIEIAHKVNAIAVVDGAQSVPHMSVDVQALDCDFLAFSSHKMCGPTGLGVLFGKKRFLEKMSPYTFGGDMISDVSYNDAKWNELPMKFESGTPHIAGAVGFAEAVKYLNALGMENIHAWEHELVEYAKNRLQELDGVTLFAPKHNAGIVSFTVKGIHHHDIAAYLNDYGVCVRVGHHCAMPLMSKLHIPGTIRASFYLYNTLEDVDAMIDALQEAVKLFGTKKKGE
jgi:cysteine desulfurase/selenocysteine lyase